MQKVTPFIWYESQAEEAARFYVSLIPDSRIETITRSPSDNPSVQEGAVLTVEFTLGGVRYIGLNGGPHFKLNEAFSMMIACADQVETDRLWDALCEGGEPSRCGWLKDRWGLSWQITPVRMLELLNDPDPARAKRAMQAMMTMAKLDIAALEAAANGA